LESIVTISIEPARTEDLPAVLALLESSGLPKDGLAEHLATTLVVRDDGRVVGSAALEVYDAAALLRSVAVAAALRGRGLGQRLVQAALDLARRRGVASVYLLTETAAGYFPRFGFRAIDRSAAPQAVQQSVEFALACPSSALAMKVTLNEVI
jgi:amino-acid N-acetyltransferase